MLLGVNAGNLAWISIPDDYGKLNSNVENSLTTAGNTLSTATNAVTTLMIAYKLWYAAVNRIRWIQLLTMKRYCRSHRTLFAKTVSSSGRKSPVRTILILLVESGLVYLAFQVSDFDILLADMRARSSKFSPFFGQTAYLVLNACGSTFDTEIYIFYSVYLSLSVSVRQRFTLYATI